MDSILIPKRYLFPDPASVWGKIGLDAQRDMKFHIFIALMGLRFIGDRAVRTQRVMNSFMQVYSVRFLDCSEEEMKQIYGTMVVGRSKIFDWQTDKGTRHGIDPKGFARLTGPINPIDVEECDIIFYPRVFRKNHPGDLFHPNMGLKYGQWGPLLTEDTIIPPLDEIGINGRYLSDHRAMARRSEKLLSDDFETTCGRVKVTYALFNDAADSFLTVKLLEWNKEGQTANVYATIRTYDTLICDDVATSVIFDVKKDEYISVKPQQYIPLHRPWTAVPMGHQLKVHVEIFHKNMRSGDNDLVIANGIFFFEAKSLKEEISVHDHQYMVQDQSANDDKYANKDQSAKENQFEGITDSHIMSGK